MGMGRTPAILFCILLVLIVLVGLIWFFSSQALGFQDQIPMIEKRGTELLNELQDWISRTFKMNTKQQVSYVENAGKNLLGQSGEIFSSISGFTGDLVTVLGLMPIYIFFILYYRTFFMNFLTMLFSDQRKETVFKVGAEIEQVCQNYLLGLLTVIVIVAVLNTAGLMLLGIENAMFFGLLASLLCVIPYIGIAIGSILPALIALVTKDSAWYALGVILIMLFVQVLEGNFITPFIVGGRVSVNQIVAVIALLVLGSLWGAIGMILAIPFTAIVKVIFDNVDGLKPWGYLLGEPPVEESKKTKRRRKQLKEDLGLN
jgi:predicted PurR-regulated permease PerM